MTGDHFKVRNCRSGASYFRSKLYLELANDGADIETLTQESKYSTGNAELSHNATISDAFTQLTYN